MERSAIGRSALFIIFVATIALTGQSTFGATVECRAMPGPPGARGMHWYYRLDRINNQHCWYLQPAGLQVRSHAIVPLSEPRPQIVVGPSLAPSQQDNLQTSALQPAGGAFIEPSDPPIGAPAAAHFTARWPDLPESVDSRAYDFAPPQRGDAADHGSSHSEQLTLSTPFVAPDTVGQLPHKSRNDVRFGLIFVAGALSVILCGGLLKLSRVLSSFLTKPRLKRELADSSETSLSELMRAMRRVDESLKATEPRIRRKPRDFVAHQRAQNESSSIGSQIAFHRA